MEKWISIYIGGILNLPQVILFDDIDIYAKGHVQGILNILEQKTFQRDKLINNNFQIQVKNYDGYYNYDNPKSYFNGQSWQYGNIKIYNKNDIKTHEGLLKDIIINEENGIASLDMIDYMYKKWNRIVSYNSSVWETCADVAKSLMDTYEISYNENEIQKSIAKLNNESCNVKVNINEQDGITLQAVLEKLGEYSCSDVYTHNNIVYFRHWQKYSGGVSISLSENDLLQKPRIQRIQSEIINQYNIDYYKSNDNPATDNTLGNISRQEKYNGQHDLPKMNSGDLEKQICFESQIAAQYIGECYINRTHIDLEKNPRPPIQIDFSIRGTHKDYIDIETYFNFSYDRMNWTDKLFEFFITEYNFNENYIKLMALEMQRSEN